MKEGDREMTDLVINGVCWTPSQKYMQDCGRRWSQGARDPFGLVGEMVKIALVKRLSKASQTWAEVQEDEIDDSPCYASGGQILSTTVTHDADAKIRLNAENVTWKTDDDQGLGSARYAVCYNTDSGMIISTVDFHLPSGRTQNDLTIKFPSDGMMTFTDKTARDTPYQMSCY